MFDFTDVETKDNDYDAIPAGKYPAYVDGVEWKTSKAGASYLNVMFKIFGDKHEGRVIFNSYNLHHDKEQVKEIAFQDIKKLLVAGGTKAFKFANDHELADAVMKCRVGIRVGVKTSEQYGSQNTIKGYNKLAAGDGVGPDTGTISADDIPF